LTDRPGQDVPFVTKGDFGAVIFRRKKASSITATRFGSIAKVQTQALFAAADWTIKAFRVLPETSGIT
jgi:hypothetical protein